MLPRNHPNWPFSGQPATIRAPQSPARPARLLRRDTGARTHLRSRAPPRLLATRGAKSWIAHHSPPNLDISPREYCQVKRKIQVSNVSKPMPARSGSAIVPGLSDP